MTAAGATRLRSAAAALAAIAIAVAVRYLLDPILGDRAPYGSFFLAMLLTAWYGELAIAVASLLIGAVLGSVLFVSHEHSLSALSFGDYVGMANYLMLGGTSLAMSQSLRRAGARDRTRSTLLEEQRQIAENSERRYRSLVNATTSIVWATDREGGFCDVQPSWEAFTGRAWPEYAGSGWLASVHAEDRTATADKWQQGRAERKSCELSFRLWNAWRDEYRQVILRAVPVFGSDAEPCEWIGAVSDVTDERRTLDALLESENRFRLMADSAPVLLWIADIEGKCNFFNKPWLAFTGRSVEEELGDGWTLGIHPEDAPRFLETYQSSYASRQPFEMEYRMRRYDGEFRWLLGNGRPILTPGGEFVGFIGSCKDITLRKRAEDTLRESEHQFRTMADAMPQIAWAASPDGCVDYFNQRWYEFTGFEEGQQGDQSWLPIVHPDDVERTHKRWYDSIQTGEIYDIEHRLRDNRGQYRWHLGRALPVRDTTGRIVRWFGTSTDIDDQKRASESLREADKAKSEFLANVSHELRTPMNAIIGMTDLALGEDLDVPVRDDLSTARESADVLLGLLNEILDFSRLEAGKFVMDLVPFALRPTIDETIKTLAVKAYEKGLELACDLPDNIPDALVGDPVRLKQVLMNLIGNAIKFTERGEIVVQLTIESRTSDEICLRFAIRDTGIGISAGDQERIFTPFTQADASTTRHYGGTGLGLAISSELVRMMGGRIWVESHLGAGSTFYFTCRLPLDAAPPPRAKPLAEAVLKLREMPVLVVDDNSTNRRILQETLESWQMRPVMAADGHAALDAIHQAAKEGHTFPLVLLDALMPGMDGFTLATWIRGEPNLAGATVLMLSSADRQAFAKRCDQLDVAVYLEKPVSKSDLLDAILRALGFGQQFAVSEEELVAGQAIETPQLDILVAEDTPANQKLIKRLLSKRGHKVEIAHNGREAVDLVRQREFDLVIMDVQMPIMDGFQATAAIRAQENPRKRHLPILAMTAHAMRGDRQRCLSAGMDAYLAKPIDSRRLLELIDSLSSEKVVAMDPRDDARNGDKPATGIVDLAGALERMGGDRQLLEDIVQFYFQDAPGLLQEIERAIAASDGPQLERSAHSLKGLASNFGAASVVETAACLETCGRTSQFDDAPALLATLSSRVAELDAELAGHFSPGNPAKKLS